jgi:type II secretory pathway component PulF
MSQAGSPRRAAVSLEELIALNDELRALARAGLPLGQGLSALSRDSRGRLSSVLSRIAAGAEQGRPIADVLADPSLGIPRYYSALVAAGILSNSLPAALEGVSLVCSRLSRIKRASRLALIYPVLIVVLAYLFFVFTIRSVIPRVAYELTYEGSFASPTLDFFARLGTGPWHWALWPPLILFSLVVSVTVLGRLFGRWLPGSRTRSWLAVLPAWRRMSEHYSISMFAEQLALLVRHSVPLADALEIAGPCSGRVEIEDEARLLAAKLRQGRALSQIDRLAETSLPRFLVWSLASVRDESGLVRALKVISDRRFADAEAISHRVRWLIPFLFTIFLAGSATIAYALLLLLPWYGFLLRIAEQ